MTRGFLSEVERKRLSNYPEDLSHDDLGRYFTLSDRDSALVGQQRGDHNHLGFALQLCTLRYLGFIPDNLLQPPNELLRLLAQQLEVSTTVLEHYSQREQTRTDHLLMIMRILGYRYSSPLDSIEMETWLSERALEHDRPTFLLQLVCERLRWEHIIRPGLNTLERLVATARERAREITYQRILPLLTDERKTFLDEVLKPTESRNRTRLGWLQQMPTDHVASQILETLDKVRFLQQAGVPDWDVNSLNPNRLKLLANIGARSSNQQLQRSSEQRRYPVLLAFLKQSLLEFGDVVLELFDACLWECHTEAKLELDELRLQAAKSTNEKLRSYCDLVKIVIDKAVGDNDVRATIFERFQAHHLEREVEETQSLIRPDNDEAIDFFAKRYSYIRKFAPRLLSTFIFKSHKQNDPLLEAVMVLNDLNVKAERSLPRTVPLSFVSDAWWPYVVEADGKTNRRYYELSVLWELRLALRSGDVFVQDTRRYADPNTYLIPQEEWHEQRREVIRLTATPAQGAARVNEREQEVQRLAERLEPFFQHKESSLRDEQGKWILTPYAGEERADEVDNLEDNIMDRLPQLEITDVLIEVDRWTGFSGGFNHAADGASLATEAQLKHLYASLLAQGCNFSLAQMTRTSGFAYHQLLHTNTWFLREETLKKANDALVNYHHGLETSRYWGAGVLSSSDGQRFPMTGKHRNTHSILRYFGYRRGITFYTWTSDQFSQYGGKAVASTLRDATYVLDEILANETELPILEHTTDTSGYTELIFALFDLLGLTFSPRIKDLQDQQLYRTEAMSLDACPHVRARLSKRLDTELILANWDELLRLAGSLKLGWVTASLIIQKLQASPRKNELTRALQEYGRLIKTRHALAWYESEEKRRWINRQLNKGEALHSLKAHLSIGNRGIIRRKSDEGLQHQVGSLNLLTNAIILWNTVYMTEAMKQLEREGQILHPEDLAHIWPTRFEHINVYGKYHFDLEEAQQRDGLRRLRSPDELIP